MSEDKKKSKTKNDDGRVLKDNEAIRAMHLQTYAQRMGDENKKMHMNYITRRVMAHNAEMERAWIIMLHI